MTTEEQARDIWHLLTVPGSGFEFSLHTGGARRNVMNPILSDVARAYGP
jgi:hypothetical protein